jgi:hypothetical protein
MESTEDLVESIAKRIFIWMVIGAFVPIFWGVVSFIFFNAPESHWTDLYWNIIYVTCPAWLLPESKWSMLITPLANAVLYGLIAFLISIALRGLSKRTARTR